MLRVALVLAALLVSPPASPARTWHVNQDGSGDAETIQAALDQAAYGDSVVVACGTYYESITMPSGVVLTSASGDPDCVFVDGQGLHRVFDCEGTDDQTLIRGFTIQNGYAEAGSGAWCSASFLTIESCRFVHNEVAHDGAAIVIAAAGDVSITECEFEGNQTVSGQGRSHSRGGAIYVWNQSAITLTGCRFSGNAAGTGGAVWAANRSAVVISDCVFLDNNGSLGGALFLADGTTLSVTTSIFAGNSASQGGALHLDDAAGSIQQSTFVANGGLLGAHVFAQSSSFLWLRQSILYAGTDGGSVVCSSSNVVVECSNIFGNGGGDWLLCLAGQEGANDNLSDDPLFCDADAGDYSLQWASPCLPANSPDGCGLIGAFGFGGCNSVSVTPDSWARVKARYR